MEVTLGGERLGSGKKQKVEMRNYERSTHDLSYVWRSSMSSGTLVPFMSQVMLPGDSFEIELNADVMTLPTIGPLFGSYKVQLDVFTIPMRLYSSVLIQNALNVGMNMQKVKFPLIKLEAETPINETEDVDNTQINPSSILAYLGIRGLGVTDDAEIQTVKRDFNALPLLAYWDIYKNYYANKQEEKGAVIHTDVINIGSVLGIGIMNPGEPTVNLSFTNSPGSAANIMFSSNTEALISVNGEININEVYIWIRYDDVFWEARTVTQLWGTVYYDYENDKIFLSNFLNDPGLYQIGGYTFINTDEYNAEPRVTFFPLENIDEMRNEIMLFGNTGNNVIIDSSYQLTPYKWLNEKREVVEPGERRKYSKLYSQEGLGLKTYQSDLFNNWISTEWIDGENGINALTAIDTSDGEFTIDTLILARKVYDVLNRIALSGGTYDDWIDASYTHERVREVQNPVYIGGLSKELVFQEVVSNAATQGEPLGTLAGRGVLSNKHKGGNITVKCDEPSYLMGIVSLTPRVDYSQGNSWDMNLTNWDELHKPGLDEIGFQSLITDQLAWFDTKINVMSDRVTMYEAGKQPAWINYMTNVNKTFGNFAIESKEMFMTLNRKYEAKRTGSTNLQIKDLTTYIDPSKFNFIFAETKLDAQNFWVQIGCDIKARRKMSAKVIPNL